jgi:hypothetical protein
MPTETGAKILSRRIAAPSCMAARCGETVRHLPEMRNHQNACPSSYHNLRRGEIPKPKANSGVGSIIVAAR